MERRPGPPPPLCRSDVRSPSASPTPRARVRLAGLSHHFSREVEEAQGHGAQVRVPGARKAGLITKGTERTYLLRPTRSPANQ